MTAGVYILLTLAVGANAPAAAEQSQFTEVAQASGIDAMVLNMPNFPYDRMNGGGAIGDFDRNGFPDLFLPSTGTGPDRIFYNQGDGSFVEQVPAVGAHPEYRGCGAAVGDYDADGWPDIYVTSFGDANAAIAVGGNRLYHNNGDGTFTEVAAAAGVEYTSYLLPDGYGATFGDYDLDGDLDLFVCGWVALAYGNRLYRNEGDGTFTDVTDTPGFDFALLAGFSPSFTDLTGDRYPELLIAGDFGTTQVYENLRDGSFADITAQVGPDMVYNGMGSCTGDFDGDGRIDWMITSVWYEAGSSDPNGNRLYRNQLDGAGLVATASNTGVTDGGWGWGAVAADFNHDGRLDIAEVNGWSDAEWQDERSCLYTALPNGKFIDRGRAAGFEDSGQGRALMSLDYDADGDVDLIIINNNGRVRLYRNDLPAGNRHWLGAEFDTSGNPALAPGGVGTRITVEAGNKRWVRLLDGGCNYLSCSELRVHFGLKSVTMLDRVQIDWADGFRTVLTDLAADQTITVAAIEPLSVDPEVRRGHSFTTNLEGARAGEPVHFYLGATGVGAATAGANGVAALDMNPPRFLLGAYYADSGGSVSFQTSVPALMPTVTMHIQALLPRGGADDPSATSNVVTRPILP